MGQNLKKNHGKSVAEGRDPVLLLAVAAWSPARLLVPPTYTPGKSVVTLSAYLCPIGIERALFADQQRPHKPSTSVLDRLDR